MGFVNSVLIKEGDSCLNKWSFDKVSSNSYPLLDTNGYCYKSSIDFEAKYPSSDGFTEKEVIDVNDIPIKSINGYEVKESLYYHQRFSSNIQVPSRCFKYVQKIIEQQMPKNELAYYYSLCFLLLQLVPIMAALIPELIKKDEGKKDELLVNVPQSINNINENYKQQNVLMTNRSVVLVLFLAEMTSGCMCSLLAYGFYKENGSYLKYAANDNCFPVEINA
jgi:hypothetical protein